MPNVTDPKLRRKILGYLATTPKTEREIADELSIRYSTCHEQARSLFKEHEVSSRLALMIKVNKIRPKLS